jgi:hypothetical protein
MNGLAKIVISRTLDTAEWAHTQPIRDDVAVELTKLKQQPGKNMVIMGKRRDKPAWRRRWKSSAPKGQRPTATPSHASTTCEGVAKR